MGIDQRLEPAPDSPDHVLAGASERRDGPRPGTLLNDTGATLRMRYAKPTAAMAGSPP